MTQRADPAATRARTLRGVIFTSLIEGQRAKHENELRKLGFEVDSRDFPKSYHLDAYDVIFILKDHSYPSDQDAAAKAAEQAGKRWFRITKKVANPTWQAVIEFARQQRLQPVEDKDSHPPSFSARSFADALADHVAKKADADDWAELAGEYEDRAKAAEAKATEVEALWKQAEVDLKDLRKRVQTAAEDANTAAAQREALRAELERVQGELTRLREAKAVGQKAVAKVDDSVLQRLRDTDQLMRDARAERDGIKEELSAAKKELSAAKKAVAGLQDTIDALTTKLAETSMALPKGVTGVMAITPAGKILVSANIVEIADKLWGLYDAGVMDIEEVWQKLMAQLKGGNDG